MKLTRKHALELARVIAHGDKQHRAWLKAAILAWSKDKPVPVAGKGRKEALIDALDQRVTRLERASR